jgi:hypothetical protein
MESEHRRLLEKWVYEDLSDEDLALLPAELKERALAHFRELVSEGLRSAEAEGWIDGPKALKAMRDRLADRRRQGPPASQ